MPSTTCMCGVELAGDDRATQVAAASAHFKAAHSELGLTDVQLRNYLERQEMLVPPGEPVAAIGDVEIVPVGPDRVDDILAFFDTDAFADNAGWASCYCIAHHLVGGEMSSEFRTRTWQQNRDDLAARIRDGRTTGTLCYADGRIVGWCNASPRAEFPHYRTGADDDTVGVATCFIVAAPYRGHGIARRLLDAAMRQWQEAGMVDGEAHPHPDPKWPGAAYRGTVALFEQAGFERAGDDNHSVVMRRALPLT